MATTIRKAVTVRSEGVLEVRSPELHPGARADVVVILDDTVESPHKPLASYVGVCGGTFKAANEVDSHIRRERGSWE